MSCLCGPSRSTARPPATISATSQPSERHISSPATFARLFISTMCMKQYFAKQASPYFLMDCCTMMGGCCGRIIFTSKQIQPLVATAYLSPVVMRPRWVFWGTNGRSLSPNSSLSNSSCQFKFSMSHSHLPTQRPPKYFPWWRHKRPRITAQLNCMRRVFSALQA